MLCPSCQTENVASAEACVECGENLRLAAPGAVLAGRYEMLGRLGKGGMGVVYKARDRLLNEIVAIKVLRPGGGATSEMTQRFLSEIKLARAVSHRNVCRIHEYGEDGGLKYISMAYVDGVDLKNVLWKNGALPAAKAYDIALQVADGLAAIHAEGIIHRDLKTANIMMDSGRRLARLMDFGIAKQWSDETGAGMTGTGQIVGSPDYMSPEQIQAKKIDFRSDIYSLAVVVYEIFTAKVPFHANTPVATLMKHLQEAPLLEGPGAPPLPPALVPVLRTALQKDREQRFASVEAMRQALVAARDARDPATRTTHVPSLKATLRGQSGPRSDDGLMAIESTEAAATPQEGIRTEPASFPPTLPRKQAAGPAGPRSPAPASRPAAPSAPAHSPAGGLSRAQLGLAAGLALTGIAILLLVLAQLRQPKLAAEPEATPMPPMGAAATTSLSAAAPASTLAPVVQASAPPAVLATRASAPPVSAARPPDTTAPAQASPVPTQAPAADTRVKALLDSAEQALETQDYDAAIRTYDEALKLDPQNQIALMGRMTAVNARVTVRASGGAPKAGAVRKLVAGATSAQSEETRAAEASLPPGFKPTAGVSVTRDTQAADLPGQIKFETEPEAIEPGASYTIRILFANAGAAPIEIEQMVLTTTVNGRKSVGGVPPQTRSIGPKQQALLRSLSDMWRGDVKTWSMEVVVRTSRGESYRNELAWK
jgi:serine/threonine-protein kinase